MSNFQALVYNIFVLTCTLAAMIIMLKSNRKIHKLLDEEK